MHSVKLTGRWHLSSLVAIALMVTSGCDRGPAAAPVRGKVTYKGTPVPKGTIRFHPVDGGRPAVGQIKPDGSYELARKVTGDGVLLGEYKVAIEASEVTNAPPVAASLEDEINDPQAGVGAAVKIKYLVPENYSNPESSGLVKTVEAGDNQIDFDLK